MFKPNIRGVGKRNLHFEATGWRNREDNSLIKHRYPWRRSWIEGVSVDDSLTPLLARSGQVFLLQNAQTAETKSVPAVRGAKLRMLVLFGVISVLGVLAGFMLNPTASAKKILAAEPNQAPSAFDCEGFLQNPEVEIASWLTGSSSAEVDIQEVQREELGGAQFRKIEASCGNQQATFHVTLTLRDQAWQLKNFTRLEN